MITSTLTSKGQTTIPLQVRGELGLKSGDRIAYVRNQHGRYEVMPATLPLANIKGLLPKRAKPVSIEEMNAAIAARGAMAR